MPFFDDITFFTHEKANSLSSLKVFFTVSVNSMYCKSFYIRYAAIEQLGGSQAWLSNPWVRAPAEIYASQPSV